MFFGCVGVSRGNRTHASNKNEKFQVRTEDLISG